MVTACTERFERRLVEETSGLRIQINQVEATLRQEMTTLGASLRLEMATLGRHAVLCGVRVRFNRVPLAS